MRFSTLRPTTHDLRPTSYHPRSGIVLKRNFRVLQLLHLPRHRLPMQDPQQRMILRPDRNRQQDTEPLAIITHHVIIQLPFPYTLSYTTSAPLAAHTQQHTFMPQLAIRELRAGLDPREDLPAQASKVPILQFGEAVAQRGADLHLQLHARPVDAREAVVLVVPVLVVRVLRRARALRGVGAVRQPSAPQLVHELDPRVVVRERGARRALLRRAGDIHGGLGRLAGAGCQQPNTAQRSGA